MAQLAFVSCFLVLAVAVFVMWPAPELSDHLIQWRNIGRTFTHRSYNVFLHDMKGSGPASEVLVILHGYPTCSYDFTQILDGLLERYGRVIAPDFLGFGLSDKPAGYEYSVMDMADMIGSLLVELKVEAFHILAHDLGDTVAQEIVARYNGDNFVPNLTVRSVCLLNGGILPEHHQPRLTQTLLLNPYIAPFLMRFMNFHVFIRALGECFGEETQPTSEEYIDHWALMRHNDGHLVHHGLIQYIPERFANRDRWVHALSETELPLHLIYGAADPINPPATFLADYKKLIPNSGITELSVGIGHYGHLEDPEGVLEGYFGFLDSLEEHHGMHSQEEGDDVGMGEATDGAEEHGAEERDNEAEEKESDEGGLGGEGGEEDKEESGTIEGGDEDALVEEPGMGTSPGEEDATESETTGGVEEASGEEPGEEDATESETTEGEDDLASTPNTVEDGIEEIITPAEIIDEDDVGAHGQDEEAGEKEDKEELGAMEGGEEEENIEGEPGLGIAHRGEEATGITEEEDELASRPAIVGHEVADEPGSPASFIDEDGVKVHEQDVGAGEGEKGDKEELEATGRGKEEEIIEGEPGLGTAHSEEEATETAEDEDDLASRPTTVEDEVAEELGSPASFIDEDDVKAYGHDVTAKGEKEELDTTDGVKEEEIKREEPGLGTNQSEVATESETAEAEEDETVDTSNRTVDEVAEDIDDDVEVEDDGEDIGVMEGKGGEEDQDDLKKEDGQTDADGGDDGEADEGGPPQLKDKDGGEEGGEGKIGGETDKQSVPLEGEAGTKQGEQLQVITPQKLEPKETIKEVSSDDDGNVEVEEEP